MCPGLLPQHTTQETELEDPREKKHRRKGRLREEQDQREEVTGTTSNGQRKRLRSSEGTNGAAGASPNGAGTGNHPQEHQPHHQVSPRGRVSKQVGQATDMSLDSANAETFTKTAESCARVRHIEW